MKKEFIFLGLTRIALGFIFLWAFFDKLLGLGFATTPERAWINGGSPTTGFLSGAEGIFSSFYQGLAGSVFIDYIFMIGLLLIGLALILGIGIKIASYSGALLMLLMWSASLPLSNNPIIDDHIIYALVLFIFNFTKAGKYVGLGCKWSKTKLVKKYRILE